MRGRHPAKKRVRRVIPIAHAPQASRAMLQVHATAAPSSAIRGPSGRLAQAAALPKERTGPAAVPPNAATVLRETWVIEPTVQSEMRRNEATAQREAHLNGPTALPDAPPSAPTVPRAPQQPTVATARAEARPSVPAASRVHARSQTR